MKLVRQRNQEGGCRLEPHLKYSKINCNTCLIQKRLVPDEKVYEEDFVKVEADAWDVADDENRDNANQNEGEVDFTPNGVLTFQM